MNRFERQCAYEDEGAIAGLAGKSREDCPYDEHTESEAWNFWVYGCENARHEIEIMKRGVMTFCSTDEGSKPFEISVEAAISNGMWRPRYVTERSS